jgi:hypothetical protein
VVVKIAGQECTVERAYELLAANEALVDQLEATAEERERLVTYGTLRSHHDYLRDLHEARGGGHR